MNKEGEIDLRQLWNPLNRRKWSILSIALVCSLLAALVAFALPPMFKASATLLIESEEANVVSIQEVYGLDSDNQQYFETQFEILKSRPIAEQVVRTLGLVDNPKFRPDEKLELPFELDWRAWLPFAVSTEPSTQVSDPVQDAVKVYFDKLTIAPVRRTQLVKVHFDSEDPQLAAQVANAHAKAYIESILDARLAVTQDASSWMLKRLDGLKQQLLESEQNLQNFREEERLVDVEGLKSLPALEINDLTSRLVDAKRSLSVAKIAYLQVYQSPNAPIGDLESAPAILDDEVVQRLLQVEAAAAQKVAELAKRYGPQHPKMISAQAEFAKATESLTNQQRSVAVRIRKEYEAAESEVMALERSLNSSKRDYQNLGRKESTLLALQREVDTNRQLYDMFYSRMKETVETGDLASANARVIAPAIIPNQAYKPRKQLIVGLTFALVLALGMIVAFLLESLDNTVRGSGEVEAKLGVPLLGMVPLATPERGTHSLGQAFLDEPDSQFAEGIRTIRTGITLSSLDRPDRVILVTSSVGAEGKSTVALNLAFAFAQVERVLLIDADLRRPSIGRELRLPRFLPGISQLIAETSRLKDCVTRFGPGNLDVLPSGLIPPDPLELISSSRVLTALTVLRNSYDRIIIDSPPILPVSDAMALSVHADSVIFVVKSDATSVHQVRSGLGQLARVNAPVTGVVLNQLDLKKAAKYSDYGYGGYYESYGRDESAAAPRRVAS